MINNIYKKNKNKYKEIRLVTDDDGYQDHPRIEGKRLETEEEFAKRIEKQQKAIEAPKKKKEDKKKEVLERKKQLLKKLQQEVG